MEKRARVGAGCAKRGNTLMVEVWGPEQIHVLVRAPRQLKTQSAFLAVLLSSPLSLAESHCLFLSCPGLRSSLFLLQEEDPLSLHRPSSCHSLRTHPDTSILSVQQLLAPVGLQLSLSPSTPKETSCSKLSTCPDTAATPSTHQAPAGDGSGSSFPQAGKEAKTCCFSPLRRHKVLRPEPRNQSKAVHFQHWPHSFCLQNSTGEPWNVLFLGTVAGILPLHSPVMACGRLLLSQCSPAPCLRPSTVQVVETAPCAK